MSRREPPLPPGTLVRIASDAFPPRHPASKFVNGHLARVVQDDGHSEIRVQRVTKYGRGSMIALVRFRRARPVDMSDLTDEECALLMKLEMTNA